MQLNDPAVRHSATVAAAGAGAATFDYDQLVRRPARTAPPKRPRRLSIQEAQDRIAALPEAETPLLWRLLEMLVAAVALVLSAPVLLVLFILVRCDSKGPALFRQPRVGRGGRLFRFTKLRTMYVDAKQRFPHLYAYDYSPEEMATLKFKIPDDPRATPAGRWLRKSTLDELPNFWHVLTGDMALVGPRPEIPEMLPYYDSRTLAKFTVRPGITGLAQVSGRGWLSFQDTVDLDLQYIHTRNVWVDTKILCLTIYRIVWGHGAF